MKIIHRVPAIVLSEKEEKIQMRADGGGGEKLAYSKRQGKKSKSGRLGVNLVRGKLWFPACCSRWDGCDKPP